MFVLQTENEIARPLGYTHYQIPIPVPKHQTPQGLILIYIPNIYNAKARKKNQKSK